MTEESETVEGNDDIIYKSIVLISLNRIYDVLCLIASGQSSVEEVQKLIDMHSAGKTWTPPPTILE